MISRDAQGLPIRIREDGSVDYTDSAFLTGMLSLFGSNIENPWVYATRGGLVRHPTGDEYVSNPANTSRDQLVAWMSSFRKCPEFFSYTSKWFINKDFLPPHVKLYLYIKFGKKAPLWLYPISYLWMFFDLLISHAIVPRFQKVEDQHELNQALCVYHELGLIKVLLAVHPNPDENMKDYYCRWRNQEEIYQMYLEWKKKL